MTEKHIEDSSAPLIDHLIELRSRLIKSIAAFVVAMMICFAIAEPIYRFMARPLQQALIDHGKDPTIVFFGPQELFFLYISLSMFGGFFFAFPIIGNQLWRFVAPGLYRSEQRAFLPFMIASPLLFIAGAAFAYFGAMPLALDFFLGFETQADTEGGLSIAYLGSAREYFSLAMKLILAFGIAFQLPVLLTLMAKAGLVGSAWLAENRKYAIVGLMVAAALVTPPDVFSMMLMFGVIYSLYEASIFLVKSVEKKREEELRAQGYYDDEDEDFEEDGDDRATEDAEGGSDEAGPERNR
jgi:sec-independent protein translocase protein TatC